MQRISFRLPKYNAKGTVYEIKIIFSCCFEDGFILLDRVIIESTFSLPLAFPTSNISWQSIPPFLFYFFVEWALAASVTPDLNHVCMAFIEHMWVYGLCHTDQACAPSRKMTWQGNMIYIHLIGIHESEAMTGASCRLTCAPDGRLTSSIGKLGWD